MEEKDNDVKQAIDDIFGDDIIEIDSGDNLTKIDEDDILSETSLSIPVLDDDSKIISPDERLEEIVTEKPLERKQHDKTFNKKILIYFMIGFIIGLILIYIIVNYVIGRQKVINCFYEAEDTGYKITDEYKIKYKNNTILYVDGMYNYTAKTEEYKAQINYIKDEKVPVIINSNGMKGFTYLYEVSDNFFKVQSYLDFTLFDYEKINKIDQKVTPISYFKINSDISFKTLKESFEKQGYVCTLSN